MRRAPRTPSASTSTPRTPRSPPHVRRTPRIATRPLTRARPPASASSAYALRYNAQATAPAPRGASASNFARHAYSSSRPCYDPEAAAPA
jgi:hypothetical protein